MIAFSTLHTCNHNRLKHTMVESQNTFDEINKSINKDRSEINTQIENIPNKKKNAIIDIQRRLDERLQSISNKRLDVEGQRDKEIKA